MGAGDMGHWMNTAAMTMTAVAAFGGVGLMGYLSWASLLGAKKKAVVHQRDMRTTWKVVQLGGPILKSLGMADKIKYGVIVSTDEMLAQTQTLLFCPLINGVDDGSRLALLPWHVEVKIKDDPERHYAPIDYEHKYISTKIVLPISHNEIDTDGRERGYLCEASQVAVADKLSAWLPQFAKVAHKKGFGSEREPHL